MPNRPDDAKWTRRDEIALAIVLAWLPSQARTTLSDCSEAVMQSEVKQAFKLADTFLTVQRGGTG